MDTIVPRVLVLLWFVVYMAALYLLLHIAVARLVRRPDSRVLWFFSVVTGPLTRPVRALAPAGTPESRLRWIALGVYAGLWLAMRIVLGSAGRPGPG